MLSEILKALDHFPKWKKINDAVDVVDDLRLRVAALEKEIARRQAPEYCPICSSALKVVAVEPHGYSNAEFHHFRCDTAECSFPGRTRVYDPDKTASAD